MRFPRRQFLHLAAGAAALPAASRIARAQTYPSRPVRLLVGFTPGGTTDIAARLMAQTLSERFSQQFVVENRSGAATNIATEAVVRAAPDGHTLLVATSSNTVNSTLYQKLNFNFMRDITMVAGLVSSPLVLEVGPSLPVQTVPELIAYAKANPGKITLASFGTGTTSHLVGEWFKMMAGVDMVHVPYRGSGPLVTDLLGGQVQCAFDNLPGSIEQIRAGKLRPLAVSTATRSESLPDIPTVGEFLPTFEAKAWVAIGVPKNTPGQIIDTLNAEINVGLANSTLKARVTELGATVFHGSPTDFSKLVADDTEKWAKVIRATNIKPE